MGRREDAGSIPVLEEGNIPALEEASIPVPSDNPYRSNGPPTGYGGSPDQGDANDNSQGYDSDEGLGAMTKVSMMGPRTSPNNCSARNRQRQPLGPMAAPAASQQELQVR